MRRHNPSAPFRPPRPLSVSSGASASSTRTLSPTAGPPRKRPAAAAATASAKESKNDAPSESEKTTYKVQWRKFTNKKNKTWDGDGILAITSTNMFLKVDKKTIAKSGVKKLDGVIRIGGYEAEVDTIDDADDDVRPSLIPQKRAFKSVSNSIKPTRISSMRQPSYPIDTPDALILRRPPDHEAPVVDVVVDPSLVKSLRPHQVEAVKFMYEAVMGFNFPGSGVLLADEMGLGKTLSTIALMWTLLKQSPFLHERSVVDKVLIVCPVTLISNWRKEIRKWLNINAIGVLCIDNSNTNYKEDVRSFARGRTYQILIIGYERLVYCEEEITQTKFDLLICDEGHKLKNSSNKALKVLNQLNIEKKVLLTGTPVQNNLNEFYNLVNFINPNILGSLNDFQKTFVQPIERSKEANCFNREIIENGKFAALQLSSITKLFIIRRTSEILFNYLTEKTDVLIFVKPTKTQLKLFHFLSSKLTSDISNSLNLINLYKKACNSPSLLTNDTAFNELRYNGELPLASGKINLLVILLMEIINKKKEKVVLISNYTKTLDVIQNVLMKLNLAFLRLDGSTNSSSRTQLINQFNQSKFPQNPIFLLSSKSGGMGINLIGASRLILFDNDWNPAHDLQSMSRIYRDGQKKPVFIYRLFTTGCIDEKIFQRQLLKNNLSDQLLQTDNPNAGADTFDMDELKDLFTIHDTSDSNTHDIICTCDGQGQKIETLIEPSTSSSVHGSSQDFAWTTALNLSQLPALEDLKRTTMKSALSDYKHFHPMRKVSCNDSVVNEVLKASTEADDLTISYVFTKVSNPTIAKEK